MRGLLVLSIVLICLYVKNAASEKGCMCPPIPGEYPPGSGYPPVPAYPGKPHCNQKNAASGRDCMCPPMHGEYPPGPGYPGKPHCNQKSLFGISNAVTGKLVKQIIDNRSPNKYESFAISVFNILHAFLVTTNAVCGNTLKQLLKYLGICNLSKIDNQFKKYRPQLQQNVTTSRNQTALVHTCAGLFPDEKFLLKPDYVRKMNTTFGADAMNAPYATEPQKAVDILNDFIRKATFGFYDKFFTSPFDPSTALVIVSTLFLEIPWKDNYFHETSNQPFKKFGSTATVPVTFLNNGNGVGAVSFAPMYNCIFVQIPTYLDQFSFIVFYPTDEKQDPASVMRTFMTSPPKVSKMFKTLKNMAPCTANVTIPEFRVDSMYSNLVAYLEAAGVKDLFTKANFCKAVKPSPMSDELRVKDVVHKATVIVKKSGLTAAAATAVLVTATAVPICTTKLKQFDANRPCGFFVVDGKNQVILFAGAFYGP